MAATRCRAESETKHTAICIKPLRLLILNEPRLVGSREDTRSASETANVSLWYVLRHLYLLSLAQAHVIRERLGEIMWVYTC